MVNSGPGGSTGRQPKVARRETPTIGRTAQLSSPFVTAGDRAYLVGSQDGDFPDRGWHVEGEMGGLWAHPIKLLAGFWLAIDGSWLPPATHFVSGAYWSSHQWDLDEGLTVHRRQFVPDGMAGIEVRYSLRSESTRQLTLHFLARVDLVSVWGSELDGIVASACGARYDEVLAAWVCSDQGNDWTVILGGRGWIPTETDARHEAWEPTRTRGNGISVFMDLDLTVDAGTQQDLVVLIVGSAESEARARGDFVACRDAAPSLERDKRLRYREMLEKHVLSTPNASLDAAWDWLKCNNDWLVRDVPRVGRGLGAGLDDYPWWFGCDSAYSVLGCLALGQQTFAVETLDLVRVLSERANGSSGRVLHEANTRGRVVHPGCTQETPHFVEAVWQVFQWTGDLAFLARHYDFCKRGILDWTLGACCKDDELLPYGYGITETLGMDLQCIDSAVHTVGALHALAEMAGVMDDPDTATVCSRLAVQAHAQLESAFWLEDEGLYADMLATPRQMIERIRAWVSATEAIEFTHGRQAELLTWLDELLHAAEADPQPDRKRGWALRYWVVITPLVAGLAPPERAARTLDRVRGSEFVGPHGMYLNGVDHTHTMSINTGALAVAELRYGRVDDALDRLDSMTDTLDLHMPGAISEMLPDYGCFVQAWSSYAVAWPVVTHMFGLAPRADLRTLAMNPVFPTAWGDATLSNVCIGDTHFDFRWDGRTMHVSGDGRPWEVKSPNMPLALEWRSTSATPTVGSTRSPHADGANS